MTFTSLDAVAATGAGVYTSIDKPMPRLSWMVKVSGNPTAVTVNLEGSFDGTTWFTVDTAKHDDAAWVLNVGELRFVVDKEVPFLRANLATLTGGTSPKVTAQIYRG